MKVLVFGAGGQVGYEVRRAAWPRSVSLAPLDRAAVDIADGVAVAGALARERPDLAVNLAAYTAVDRAESEPDLAWKTNCAGAALLAACCGDCGVPLVHLSTDYVFDGAKPVPYTEDDPAAPLGVYGASKEAGERAVRAALARHVILRTAWVYGVHGTNFVKTILRRAAQDEILRVVADQRGAPTAAADLAAALVVIARRVAEGTAVWGTFHLTGAGAVSWHGFAEAIVERAAPFLGRRPRIEPIGSAEYRTAARRPPNSLLECGRIGAAYGIRPRPWPDGLAAVVAELFATGSSGENRARAGGSPPPRPSPVFTGEGDPPSPPPPAGEG
ncbi:MAG TPA: dTDP-4-dehydrorhamnose reductase [Stellaceae bacterium]|nr:dTDP-4-dehydrorhamnose reductase [Stellaceae bacterium]